MATSEPKNADETSQRFDNDSPHGFDEARLSRLCQQCTAIFSRSMDWYDEEAISFNKANGALDDNGLFYQVGGRNVTLPCGCPYEEPQSSWFPCLSYTHHPLMASFEKAVSYGCMLCASIRSHLSEYPVDTVIRDSAFPKCYQLWTSFTGPASDQEHVVLGFRIVNGGERDPEDHGMLQFPMYGDSWQYEIAAAAASTDSTGSPETLDLARTGLQVCLNNHQYCPSRRSPSQYPTRLLKLEDSRVRLIDCDLEVLQEPYATLSHCWGTERFMVLGQDTEQRFRIGVAIEDFPQSFQDAFCTARHLSIQYIWIDCFCIIQDTTDWDVESPRMQEVYSNAVLNIGASHAKRPSDGCFHQRSSSGAVQRRIFIKWPSGTPRAPLRSVIFTDLWMGHAETEFKDQTIFTRAWIVQERLLAPRMLHFGRDRISWECASANYLDEDSPAGEMSHKLILDRNAGPGVLAIPVPSALRHLPGDDCRTMWGGIFSDYSRANLTHTSDKAVAIQSVAERVAKIRGSYYVNGFIVKDLPMTLCWKRRDYCLKPGDAISQAGTGRAPSWNWLSMDGPLELPYTVRTDYEIQLLSAYIWPGRSKDIYIIGRVWQLLQLQSCSAAKGCSYFFVFDCALPTVDLADCLFIPIFQTIWGFKPNDSRRKPAIYGLILTEGLDRIHRRVGSFEMCTWESWHKVCMPLRSAKPTLFHIN